MTAEQQIELPRALRAETPARHTQVPKPLANFFASTSLQRFASLILCLIQNLFDLQTQDRVGFSDGSPVARERLLSRASTY